MAAVIQAGTELGSVSTVKTSSAQSIARNNARRSITIQNRSTSTLYVKLTAPASGAPTGADSHFAISAGGSTDDGTASMISLDNYIGAVYTNAVAQTVVEFIY